MGGEVEGGAQAESSSMSGEHKTSSQDVQTVSHSVSSLLQAILEPESIIPNTSEPPQAPLENQSLDGTDTWKRVFRFVFFPLANNQGYSCTL